MNYLSIKDNKHIEPRFLIVVGTLYETISTRSNFTHSHTYQIIDYGLKGINREHTVYNDRIRSDLNLKRLNYNLGTQCSPDAPFLDSYKLNK